MFYMTPIKTDAELAELLDLFVDLNNAAGEARVDGCPQLAEQLAAQAAQVRDTYCAERRRASAASNMALMIMTAESEAYALERELATAKARGYQRFSMVAPAGGAGIGVGGMSTRQLFEHWAAVAQG